MMSLSQTEREMVDNSLYRLVGKRLSFSDMGEDVMLAMGMLSDAQERMVHGDTETARQYINRAKYVLSYYTMEQE